MCVCSPCRLTILLAQPCDELFGWNDAHFSLLISNTMEEVCKAGKQVLLPPRLASVCQDLLSEWSTEIKSLQHRVAVTGVPKLENHI